MNNLKPQAHHTTVAYRFFLMSAAELGSNKACSAALMVTSLSTKQPWHTKYCHIKVSYSDSSANYATHYMLTLTKNYAVKAGRPRLVNKKCKIRNGKLSTMLKTQSILSYFIFSISNSLLLFLPPSKPIVAICIQHQAKQ